MSEEMPGNIAKADAVAVARHPSAARKPLSINLAGPVTVRRSGLIIPPSISLRVWERLGEELRSISDSSAWWLADWVIHGEAAYNGRYREVIERTGLDYKTLRNYVWVARRFDVERRRDSLSFGHHAEVAPLPQPEQDYWLRIAEQKGWTRNQLRKEVRASLAERRGEAAALDPGSDQTGTVDGLPRLTKPIQVLLQPEQVERCEKLAMSHGLSLNEWAARVLQSAVSNYEG
jgi:hypothetical protein